jgi:hypothetical protein
MQSLRGYFLPCDFITAKLTLLAIENEIALFNIQSLLNLSTDSHTGQVFVEENTLDPDLISLCKSEVDGCSD